RDQAVLEVSCGPGSGLGCLAGRASKLVAGDYCASHLAQARTHYGPSVPLVQLDATALPFRPASFDVVLLLEAIYFLPHVGAFLDSCHDALKRRGVVLVVTVNPDWEAFNPSPLSTKYWTAKELSDLLRTHQFSTEMYAGFPARDPSPRGRLAHALKRSAVKRKLIPKTMRGKQLLKRLAFGKLEPFPAEVTTETGSYQPPVRLADMRATADYKVLYAVARKE